MSVKAVIIKKERDPFTWVSKPDERVEIEAPTQDELLALFFRDYDNCYKYVNSLSYRFEDPKLSEAYRVWFSDISNYAANGGDMW